LQPINNDEAEESIVFFLRVIPYPSEVVAKLYIPAFSTGILYISDSEVFQMTATPRTPVWFLLTRHWLSLLGAALSVTAVLSLFFVAPHEIRGHAGNPYIGIVIFLILPAVFFTGLALMPIGVYLSKRQIKHGLLQATYDRKTALRRLAWFLGVTTLANVLIGTQLTYRAVRFMETPRFCGSSCHTMKPQFTAYQNSPHSRVECVDCHVAPGAKGWVRSKMNGTRQLVQTILNTQPRPVPSALSSGRLVPARETCENCHWPHKFGGVRLRVFTKFGDDQANTRTDTVLMMIIGGNGISGIHGAHAGPGIHIRYASADPARQSIPWVEYRNNTTGEARTFVSPDMPKEASNPLPRFEMQCVDCHNRPTHTFDLPERAMDKAIAFGDIPSTLPFVRKKGVELLNVPYRSSEEAAGKLPAAMVSFYRQNLPDIYARRSADIDTAATAVLTIYNRNVFPDLKVTWGTYPDNLGHTDFPGCFRCHDGAHASDKGTVITQDCNTCHEPLAMDEAAPEILKRLGIAERLTKMQKQ
jgi:nitrate/TMAO reductase-like tetraheme cytochrome c subunit